MYDLLIRGGRIVDPSMKIDALKDLAVNGDRIAEILDPSKGLAAKAKSVINATGKIVVPGLIDFHVHVFPGVSHFGVDPDTTCLSRGVTTVLDFGTAGGWIFNGFRRFVIDVAQTRVLALLHIAAQGLIDSVGMPPKIGELHDLRHCDVDLVKQVADENRDVIRGIKIRCTDNLAEEGRNEAAALDLARTAADEVKMPLVIHSPNSTLSIEHILDRMNPGDVLTHCFHGKRCGLVDEQLRIPPHIRRKLDSGILLDVGHGFSSFDFQVARRLLEQGIVPHFISSDIHHYNVHGPVHDLVTTMDKFLHLGMSLNDIIERTTRLPASYLQLENSIGTFKTGAYADITVLELQNGDFDLQDSEGNTETGHQHLEPVCAIRSGQQVKILPRPA